MMPSPETEAKVKEIADKAVGEIVALYAAELNANCPCGIEHEIVHTDWTVIYETVDLREGSHPAAHPDLVTSSNSAAHALGQIEAAGELLRDDFRPQPHIHIEGP